MNARKKLLFKVDNEVVLEESGDLYLNHIDEIKWVIAEELECGFDDVEVEVFEFPIELSEEIDLTDEGLVFWKSLHHKPILGVFCEYEEGSDEYLDAILDGSIEEKLHFFI